MPRRIYPNLLAFFKDSGESQTQIADELGISYGFLSMIKWGQRQASLPLSLRIAARCNVPLESLVRRDERTPTRKAS